jgi:type IV pilus assembly protein PilW
MRRQRGFTLIELLVALALGLLVSIGIIALFQSTNNTNRVQDAQARLQENGRYAVSRLVDDLRMGFGLPLSNEVNSSSQANNNGDVVQTPMIAPTVYVANIASLLPRWITGDTVVPAAWTTARPNQPYPFSPRWMIQGHECAVGSATCTPAVPTTLPAIGTAAGSRVRGADVLTVRYIGSAGWNVANVPGGGSNARQACTPGVTVSTLSSVVISPQAGEPTTNFQNNDLALMWTGTRGMIFQVTVVGAVGAASQTLTPVNVLATPGLGAFIPCAETGSNSSLMVYNFTRDLRTASYFLQLIADPNPDAPAGRVIPALMRWVEGAPLNTRTAEIMATGVERLDFIYGVETLANSANASRNAVYNFLDANQVQTTGTVNNCPLPPISYRQFPGSPYLIDANCMWRAVRTIEAHMLINTVNDLQFLTPTDEAFRYSVNGGTAVAYVDAAIPGAMANGLARGRMLRREFTAQVAVRNGTP